LIGVWLAVPADRRPQIRAKDPGEEVVTTGESVGRCFTVAVLGCVVGVLGCARPPVAEVYPEVAEYDGREIAELSFENTEPFSADTLEDLTETHETDCSLLFLPFCIPGTDIGRRVGRVDMRTVGADLARLGGFYRQNGYFGTRVVPEIEELEDEDDAVRFRFVVRRGDGIVLDSVVVEGTEGIADPDSLEAELPLQAGELLDLRKFVASADTVVEALRRGGHAYAEVLRNYAVDTIQDRATVWLLAVPGPRVVVDTIMVTGLEELDRSDIMRQLTFRSDDLLRLRDLRSSQRNRDELQLIRFASFSVAPDSVQLTPEDSTTATVRVAIVEAPEHVVEAQAGFGTVDCFRVRGQWTDRSVLGQGRQLTLTGSLSRIGLGNPVRGLENSLCAGGKDREIAPDLDYRVAADFTQPYFLAPTNQLAATAYAERQSEPDLYSREATGVRFAVSHRFRPRETVSGALEVERRSTEATPELYCLELLACGDDVIDRLSGPRWRNALGATWLRDRGNSAVNPTSGYVLRSNLLWSTGLLGSDYDFLRADLESAVYRPVGNGWVLAAFARFGSFLTQATLGFDDFVPPEERFFAGGANSVRGYDRLRLGPGLYLVDNDTIPPEEVADPDELGVAFVPTGGTSLGVVSTEARFPSPVLRDLLRLAVFVDAGTVGLEPIWKAGSQWRVTPGFGFRVTTPVGPARIDVGYNPYPRPRAPLYATDPDTDVLVRIREDFRADAPSTLSRFTLHIAVGQAF
jgi:outer membrane protein assembly factor BamA